MPRPTVPVAVRHPITGQMVTLDPGSDFAADDLMVESYPWAFAPTADSDLVLRESVPVEQATAAPGEKRSRTRAQK